MPPPADGTLYETPWTGCGPTTALERQRGNLFSGRTCRSLSARSGLHDSYAFWRRGKEGGFTLLRLFSQEGANQNLCRVERETGLEPATPCLERRRVYS